MKCPGQDSRYWKPGAIFESKCPKCGYGVEFFKDDTTRICRQCGHRFLNPELDFGCASYCQYAEQCIGNLPPELIEQKEGLFKERVAVEMKKYFNKDFKRIGHASRVARYAERLARDEGGDLAVILPAAYLHDIGLKEAEKQHPGQADRFHSKIGGPIAKEILTRLGAKEELIEEIIDIVSRHHQPEDHENLHFKIIYDADAVVNIEDKIKDGSVIPEELPEKILTSLLTARGQQLAREVLLPEKGD
jgi:putative nucleotidyltransferase with HDIG domain